MDKVKKRITDAYLSFCLADEIFALHVSQVRKILELVDITEVPRTPDYMRGVINLRGHVLPVLDLNIKFGLPPFQSTKTSCILVIETELDNEAIMLGILVDSVQSVLKIKEEQILPPPSIGKKFKTDFISGMTRVEEKFYMILDMNLILKSNDVFSIKDIKKVRESVENENNNS
ncbi:chemotaxis protein CheW [Anaerophaga thermohalophila]|uniref:chemotaxis protein CheW n=1 Tax=Anaerophaga thermohalophila TaxID=177400 RepID=UPI0002F7B970|nr:chemotaxis protein CheW [Anaerophaga thermohalophila]